ncbi:hypothetical protein QR680_010113 [Steinernema hermaphroditum]|uniref:Uncharacterized protein n=1 Tax=Steinernema hermaphroditum TaxID=289476 RepID=A0AA39IPQ2_9BILA|nr:hypothetical protein QR680_010113 [Steinernema hermaphroditum]
MSYSYSELQHRIGIALPPPNDPCSVYQFLEVYRAIHNEDLPFEEFGFNSARDLLETESMRDVALVTAHPNGLVSVHAATASSGAPGSSSDISEQPRRRHERRARSLAVKPPPLKSAPPSAELAYSLKSRKLKLKPAEILDEDLPSKYDLLMEIKRRGGSMRVSELDLYCVRNHGFPLSLENAKRILGTKQASSRHEAFNLAFPNELFAEYSLDGNHLLTVVQANTRDSILELIRSSHKIHVFDLTVKAKKRLNMDLTLAFLNEEFGCDAKTLCDAYEYGLGENVTVKRMHNGNGLITYIGPRDHLFPKGNRPTSLAKQSRAVSVPPVNASAPVKLRGHEVLKGAILEEIRRCGSVTLEELENFCEKTLHVSLGKFYDTLGVNPALRHKAIEEVLKGHVRMEASRHPAGDITFVALDSDGRKVKNLREIIIDIVRRHGSISHYDLKSRLLIEHNIELTLDIMNKTFGTQKTNPLEIVKEAFQGVIAVSGQCKSPGKELIYSYMRTAQELERPMSASVPSTPSHVTPEVQYARLLADFLTSYIKEQAGIRIFVTDVGRVLLHRYGHIPQFTVPQDYGGCLQFVRKLVACSDGQLELAYVGDLGFLKLTEDVPIGVQTAPDPLWNDRKFPQLDGCSISSNMDFDLPVSAGQSEEIDISQIFADLSKAIFHDFHQYVSGEEGEMEFCKLLGAFESSCRYGVQSMRKLPDDMGVDANQLRETLLQLEKERDAYRLMARLINSNAEVQAAKEFGTKSVLTEKLREDVEFRRLRVLLKWVEEVALEDPEFFSDLSHDLKSFDDISFIFSNTQFDLQTVPNACDLDFDGRFAKNTKLNAIDAERVEKGAKVILHLLKCGRYTEVKDLLDRFGFPSLVPFIAYKDFLNDPELSTLDTKHENYDLYKARLEFKEMAKQIISQDDSPLPATERIMLALLVGEIEPLMSLSNETTHKLFTFLNASLESRLDAALTNKTNGNNMETDAANDLSVEAIFDEITQTEKLPYYQVYRFVTVEDSERAVSYMLEWTKEMKNNGGLNTQAQVLRFFVHLSLMFKASSSSFQEEELHQLLRYYIELLKDMNFLTFIPFYISHLPKDEALSGVVDMLYDLEESSDFRRLVLVKVEQAGFNPTEVCEKVYDKVLAENAKPDADDSTTLKIFNVFPYLLYQGKDTAIRAMVEANSLLRLFFEIERLDLGTDLMEVINQTIKKDLEDVVTEYWSDLKKEISPQCADYINEFSHYKSYYTALDLYETWQCQWDKEIPAMPEPLLRSKYDKLTVTQKNQYANERRIAKEKIERQGQHRLNCKKEAVNALSYLLDIETQLFVATNLSEDEKETERATKLAGIRRAYIVKICMMLINLYSKSGEHEALVELAATLVDCKSRYYEILTKEQLRKLNHMLTSELECYVSTNMLP